MDAAMDDRHNILDDRQASVPGLTWGDGVADRSEYRTCGTFTTTDPYPDIVSKPLSYLGSYRRNLNWSHRTDGSLSRNLDA